MKKYPLLRLTPALLLMPTASLFASFTQDFTAAEGFTDGDLDGQGGWAQVFAGNPEVSDSAGTGSLILGATGGGISRAYSNAELGGTFDPASSIVEYEIRFKFGAAIAGHSFDPQFRFSIGGFQGDLQIRVRNDGFVSFFDSTGENLNVGDYHAPNSEAVYLVRMDYSDETVVVFINGRQRWSGSMRPDNLVPNDYRTTRLRIDTSAFSTGNYASSTIEIDSITAAIVNSVEPLVNLDFNGPAIQNNDSGDFVILNDGTLGGFASFTSADGDGALGFQDPTLVTGQSGVAGDYAVTINGVGDNLSPNRYSFVEFPIPTALDNADELTIMFWTQHDLPAASSQAILFTTNKDINDGGSASDREGIKMEINVPSTDREQLQFRFNDDASFPLFTTSNSYDGRWVMYVIRYHEGYLNLYKNDDNGNETDSAKMFTVGVDPNYTDNPGTGFPTSLGDQDHLRIGGGLSLGGFTEYCHQGDFDNFRVYDRLLSDEEIEAFFLDGQAGIADPVAPTVITTAELDQAGAGSSDITDFAEPEFNAIGYYNSVSDFSTGEINTAGFFSETQILDVRPGSTSISISGSTATITLDLETTTDLGTIPFAPVTQVSEDITVDPGDKFVRFAD